MSDRPFQILILPGGGFLGLHAAVVLDEFEQELGHSIGRHFDLIAGTSVGGIIALGLAAEVPAAKIVAMFEDHGPSIFPKRWFSLPLRRSLFKQHPLKEAVISALGSEMILGDAKHPVVLPTVNMSKGSPSILKTPHHVNFSRDWKMRMTDVALATSAAPTLFPIAEVDDRLYSDGAFFANSPELVALHEAQVFFDRTDADISILTVGCTTASISQGHSEGTNWGLYQWFKNQRILEFMMASQVSIVREMVGHRLGDQYEVVDSDRGKYAADEIGLSIATPDAIKTLRGLGKERAKAAWGSDSVRRFFEHAPPAPKFFHGPNMTEGSE